MPTLGADYDEIQGNIAYFLGWGRASSAWDEDKNASLFAWVKSGLQRFLFAALVPGMKTVYQWTFLGRAYSFGTQINQTEYDLPSDFGAPSGPIIWASPTMPYEPVPIVNEAMVRARLAFGVGFTGVPTLAAVFPRRTDGAREQRQALLLYPAPDGSYPLRLSYDMLPDMLTAAFPWPPGAAPHARTLNYACLAEACRLGDDSPAYEQDYQMALAASINYDSRQKGDNLGYNADRRNVEYRGDWDHGFHDLRVKYNGVQY